MGVFGDRSVLFRCLFNNGGEIATAAVFRKNAQNSKVSVDVSVMLRPSVLRRGLPMIPKEPFPMTSKGS